MFMLPKRKREDEPPPPPGPQCTNLLLGKAMNGSFASVDRAKDGKWYLNVSCSTMSDSCSHQIPVDHPPRRRCEGFLRDLQNTFKSTLTQSNLRRPFYAIQDVGVYGSLDEAKRYGGWDESDKCKRFRVTDDAFKFSNQSIVMRLLQSANLKLKPWGADELWSLQNSAVEDIELLTCTVDDIVHLECDECFPRQFLKDYCTRYLLGRIFQKNLQHRRPYQHIRYCVFSQIPSPLSNYTHLTQLDYSNIFRRDPVPDPTRRFKHFSVDRLPAAHGQVPHVKILGDPNVPLGLVQMLPAVLGIDSVSDEIADDECRLGVAVEIDDIVDPAILKHPLFSTCIINEFVRYLIDQRMETTLLPAVSVETTLIPRASIFTSTPSAGIVCVNFAFAVSSTSPSKTIRSLKKVCGYPEWTRFVTDGGRLEDADDRELLSGMRHLWDIDFCHSITQAVAFATARYLMTRTHRMVALQENEGKRDDGYVVLVNYRDMEIDPALLESVLLQFDTEASSSHDFMRFLSDNERASDAQH